MGRGRAFWPVLTLVLLGHGAVLTLLQAAPPPIQRGLAVAPPRVFQVRPLQVKQKDQAVAIAAPAPASEPLPAATTAPGPAAPPVTSPPRPFAPAVAAPPPEPDPPYIPRSQLTAGPVPLTLVDVPFPDGVKGVVDLKVQATLFIDEQGLVRRVRVDTPDVQPVFEQVIRDTFSRAHFKPGEIQAVAVRSQVRVEVEFNTDSARRR
ncbi:MAG: TonB protein [Ramlibacter sp.]|nr:TonB protein [Ramlibacter sp.]